MSTAYKFMPDPYSGCLTDDDTKKYFSRFAFALFGFELASFCAYMLISELFVAIVNLAAPSLLDSVDFVSAASHILNFAAIYAVALPIFCAIAAPLPTVRPAKETLGVGSFIGGFCICLVFMQAGNYISNSIVVFIENVTHTTLVNPVQTMVGQSSMWIDVVFIVILAPVLEELFFRKILCGKLLALGEGYAVLLSAVLFGLSHGNFFQFAYTALVGAVLGFIYIKTGRLIYSIIYHALLNLLGGVIAPWIVNQVDLDLVNSILGKETLTDADMSAVMSEMLPLLIYELAFMVVSIIGIVLVFRAIKRRRVSFDTGILPPPKKKRISNLLCTVGSAALVTAYVALFVLSILPR